MRICLDFDPADDERCIVCGVPIGLPSELENFICVVCQQGEPS